MPRRKYHDPAEMQAAIDQYFRSCEGRLLTDQQGIPILNRQGRPVIVDARPLTMSGLVQALGFATRKSLRDYRRKRGFRDIIDTARLRVECYNETRLYDRDGVRGAEFTLRLNWGWDATDKTKKQQENSMATVQVINKPAREI